MPYIDKEFKEEANQFRKIDNLTDYIIKLPIEKLAGFLNYLNFIIVRRWIKRNGKKYFVFAIIIGTLILCILEIWKRIICDYECEKILKNGDAE